MIINILDAINTEFNEALLERWPNIPRLAPNTEELKLDFLKPGYSSAVADMKVMTLRLYLKDDDTPDSVAEKFVSALSIAESISPDFKYKMHVGEPRLEYPSQNDTGRTVMLLDFVAYKQSGLVVYWLSSFYGSDSDLSFENPKDLTCLHTFRVNESKHQLLCQDPVEVHVHAENLWRDVQNANTSEEAFKLISDLSARLEAEYHSAQSMLKAFDAALKMQDLVQAYVRASKDSEACELLKEFFGVPAVMERRTGQITFLIGKDHVVLNGLAKYAMKDASW